MYIYKYISLYINIDLYIYKSPMSILIHLRVVNLPLLKQCFDVCIYRIVYTDVCTEFILGPNINPCAPAHKH